MAAHVIDTAFTIPYAYRTCFADDLFGADAHLLADACRGHRRVLVLAEEAVLDARPELPDALAALAPELPPSLGLRHLPGGEQLKSEDGLHRLCALLDEAAPCRQSAVVLIGGGAFLDAAGLAVALFHRGVDQIRVPTTALSQCDSGVGVKNAINAFGRKNLLGVFAPPHAVLNDAAMLATLPLRERRHAIAECAKVALLRDADLFAWLERHAEALADGDLPTLRHAVRRSAELHLLHIGTAGDPFEHRSARPLDFGHWAAHRLEALARGQARHGEAVALGLLIDTWYAEHAGILDEPLFDRLLRLLTACRIPMPIRHLDDIGPDGDLAVMAGLDEFREHLGGSLVLTFPTVPGQRRDCENPDRELLKTAVRAVAERLQALHLPQTP